jgi:hypothetical protein
MDWNNWRENPPPRLTWVWAAYSESGEQRIVKTCRQGCCVHTEFGTMLLPAYWIPTTEKEAEAELARWNAMPQIDWGTLT